MRLTRNRRAPAYAVAVALVLSVLLAVAAVVDQTGARSLTEHAAALYSPYGKRAEPGVLYGIVYSIAGVDGLLWLLMIPAVLLLVRRETAR